MSTAWADMALIRRTDKDRAMGHAAKQRHHGKGADFSWRD